MQSGGIGGNTGAIDLYKRGCFVLEGQQCCLSEADKAQAQRFRIGSDVIEELAEAMAPEFGCLSVIKSIHENAPLGEAPGWRGQG
jgi:hypothetical protein